MLVSLAEQLEEERKTRLLAVFNEVNRNFTRAYRLLQPGGEGELQLENTKNPFEGGLRMACIPPGKSKRTRRSFLSGGEKSMAALAFAVRARAMTEWAAAMCMAMQAARWGLRAMACPRGGHFCFAPSLPLRQENSTCQSALMRRPVSSSSAAAIHMDEWADRLLNGGIGAGLCLGP